MSRSTRRQFLTRGITATGVAAASVLGAGALDDLAGAAANPPSTDPATPAEALRRLVKGNQRFVSGNLKASGRGTVRRVRVAYGQEPYAVILTCSDSRVPPELVFDQGLGDLFIVRVAGNTAADPLVIGSIEYGVAVLGANLVFVLGHSECGAVKGAIDVATKGATLPGDIGQVVAPIVPAVQANLDKPANQLLESCTQTNIERAIAQMSAVPLLRDLVSQGKLMITGGEYELESGHVDLVKTG